MTLPKKNFIYNVGIYQYEDFFYVMGLVRMPPHGASVEILPVYTVKGDNVEQLAQAIESARLGSDAQYPPKQSILKRQKWDGKNEEVWNKAQKSWSILWADDENVYICPSVPYIKHKNGVEWIFVKDAEKNLPPPVSSLNIAQEITNQIKK